MSARHHGAAAALEVDAAAAGFSASKLHDLDTIVEGYIDARRIPGAVVLVGRRNQVAYFRAFGTVRGNTATNSILGTDTIFWLASMTKPVMATAILMLVEQGKVRLDDRVSRFIPEFAEPRMVRVFEPGTLEAARDGSILEEPPHTLVPALEDITVQRLLSHTSGLQSVGVPNRAIPPLAGTDTVAEWVPKLARVPLDFEPGTRWAYSNAVAYEVLVRIVEVASGKPIDAFLRERLFGPLRMTDSGFGMQHRKPGRAMPLQRKLADNPCVTGRTYFCGSAGLWATAADYFCFAQMLASGGCVRDTRILAHDTVRLMASDQTKGLFPGWRGIAGAGAQMGLGVLVIIDPVAAKVDLPAGSFGWDGIGSRRFWAVPSEEMVLIMLIPSGNAEPVHRSIERAVLDAVVS
jgi:CubicO group peptidase (beta-lactamase class C family)